MKKTMVVLDADSRQCRALCNILEEGRYEAIPIHSLESMQRDIHEDALETVIMDIDTVTVDNQAIKK